MTHEQLVPTLETCKLLKEAVWVKDVYFYWYYTKFTPERYGREWLGKYDDVQVQMVDDVFPAPTLQELLEELRLGREVFVKNIGNDWHIGNYKHNRETEKMEFDPNPAEAAALLWLKLHKHKVVV